MEKIVHLKILIIGLRGLGIEIAKNLILMGPKQVSIYDKNICSINDLSSNFYIEDNDISKNQRDIACLKKLSSLNPYVKVDICKNDNLLEVLKNYSCIIITEIKKLKYLFEIDKICRRNNVAFIYTGIFGLSGFLFNDFGDNHIIYNQNGLENLSYDISHITQKGKMFDVYLNLKDKKYIELNDGDYVKFKQIKGLIELNHIEPIKIIIKDNNLFSFEKKIKTDSKYISGGIVEEVKIPKKKKFMSLEDKFYIPYYDEKPIILDATKKNENKLLHIAIVSLHQYFEKYNKLPDLNNLSQVKEVVEFAKEFYNKILNNNNNNKWIKIKKKNKEINIPFDESYIIRVARWSKSEINPICTFLGGIVAQEAIKITGKYEPIYQWLRFDFFETIDNIPDNCNRDLLNSRYDDQIAIFGNEIQKKLSNLNIFMIGAGALGCEYLKNFALMGISTSEKNISNVTVTDNDYIELSNLSRQFLFKNTDIGKSKSICACREAKIMNNNFNCISIQKLVCKDTEKIFNDNFWEKQNIIISAVDNLSARKYIDNKCTFFSLPLIDAGTEGTNASSDIFYPWKTICYNDLPEPKKMKYAVCTLKKFPTQIEHCIEWSKEIFKELFEESINELKLVINDKFNFINILKTKIDSNELYYKLEKIKYFSIILENPTKQKIIDFAIFIFHYYFNILIENLLKEHPLESKLDDTNLFWENGKKPPHCLEINVKNNDHILFFKSFYYILSHIINYKEIIDDEELINIILNSKCINNINNKNNDIEKGIERLEKNKEKINTLIPEIFNKDKDENFHINCILALSNLRAENYKIEKCNFLKAKEVAGNIIPVVITSTATITGFASLQIYTMLQTNNIKFMKGCSINIGLSQFNISNPEQIRYFSNQEKTENSKEIRVITGKYSVWDSIKIIGPNVTIEEIVNYFKKKFNIDIDFINSGTKNLVSLLDSEEEFTNTVEDLYTRETGIEISKETKYIELQFVSSDKNTIYSIPKIKYCLKENKKNEEKFIFENNLNIIF